MRSYRVTNVSGVQSRGVFLHVLHKRELTDLRLHAYVYKMKVRLQGVLFSMFL